MGELYRPRDPKLNRDATIKVLPESVARGPDYLARFQREAQVRPTLGRMTLLVSFSGGQHGPGSIGGEHTHATGSRRDDAR
jgi:serine/threonine protein kinase